MKLLILGGTVFLGHETARQAVADGHEVTCVARGESGTTPEGARFVRGDLAEPGGLDALAGEEFDAVVDVGRRPSLVRNALAALADRVGHWTYVSTINVYSDDETPFQRPDTSPLIDPGDAIHGDLEGPPEEAYPRHKRACELAVLDAFGPERSFLCRAGLIVGPHDRSDRFTYWPVRMARGGEVLAPGNPDDLVQWVDVRDLAAWLIDASEQRRSGAYDGIGMPIGRADLLAGVAAAVGSDFTFTWVDQEFLAAQQVNPWAGPRSLPMWLPVPEAAGVLGRDASPSLAAGLAPRSLAATAKDTLTWYQSEIHELKCGLSPAEEAEVLEAWAAR